MSQSRNGHQSNLIKKLDMLAALSVLDTTGATTKEARLLIDELPVDDGAARWKRYMRIQWTAFGVALSILLAAFASVWLSGE